jgi:hypothetical protein
LSPKRGPQACRVLSRCPLGWQMPMYHHLFAVE